jgi:site-specific recombinase XerD
MLLSPANPSWNMPNDPLAPVVSVLQSPVVVADGARSDFAPAEATNDAKAISLWLESYECKSQHTVRALKKECHRFMAWLWTRHGPDATHLPKVGVADVTAYQRFLAAPRGAPLSPEALAVFGFKGQPFRVDARLSASSVRQAIVILHGMFEAMRNLRAGGGRPYIELNPFTLARTGARSTETSTKVAERALTPAECDELDATIEAMPRGTDLELATYHRARWLVALLVRSWLRRSEVARLTMGSFRPAVRCEGWNCSVKSKGGKTHTIVVTSHLLRELQVYRLSLGLPALPQLHEDRPAVASLRSPNAGLTADMLYKIVKDLANRTAARLTAQLARGEREDISEVELMVDRLRSLSPHWFRHTGVTNALESGTEPRYAQAQAGHASLTTTMIYDHKDVAKQRQQLERVR